MEKKSYEADDERESYTRFDEGLLSTSYATLTFWNAWVALTLPGNLLCAGGADGEHGRPGWQR